MCRSYKNMGLQAHSLGAEVVQLAGSRSPGAAVPSVRLRMGSRVPLDGEELQVRCLLTYQASDMALDPDEDIQIGVHASCVLQAGQPYA